MSSVAIALVQQRATADRADNLARGLRAIDEAAAELVEAFGK